MQLSKILCLSHVDLSVCCYKQQRSRAYTQVSVCSHNVIASESVICNNHAQYVADQRLRWATFQIVQFLRQTTVRYSNSRQDASKIFRQLLDSTFEEVLIYFDKKQFQERFDSLISSEI